MIHQGSITVNISRSAHQSSNTSTHITNVFGAIENEYKIIIKRKLDTRPINDLCNTDDMRVIDEQCAIEYCLLLTDDMTLNHYKLKYPEFADTIKCETTFKKFLHHRISLECAMTYGFYYAPYVPMMKYSITG